MRHIFSLRAIPISNDPEGAHVDAQDGQLEPRRAIGTLGAAMLEPIRAGLQIAGETQTVNHLFDFVGGHCDHFIPRRRKSALLLPSAGSNVVQRVKRLISQG